MNEIYKILRKEISKNLDKKIVVLCVGNSKVTGDSLGPYVGEKLTNLITNNNIVIKGCLNKPIHYMNIQDNIHMLKEKYNKLYIITVDSTLYTNNYIGKTIIAKSSTILGSALYKNKHKIGDISIKGIVGKASKNNIENYKTLKMISKTFIKEMSEKIAEQIYKSIV